MIQITATDVFAMVHQDYENNFHPRKEIGLRLSFEQLKEFLKNKELQSQIRLTWHFKFYIKQLFILSWNQIHHDKNLSPEIKIKMIEELHLLTEFANFNETRALVAFIKLEFFLSEISNFNLHDMFSGTSLYDDHCAQLAYYEYNRRGGSSSGDNDETDWKRKL